MCGICGHVAFSSVGFPETTSLRVEAMLRSLSHRGPDASRVMNTDLAVVGATRLAVRGLNERASQPMTDTESGVLAVCNGEIDNHRELRRWFSEVRDAQGPGGAELIDTVSSATRLPGQYSVRWNGRDDPELAVIERQVAHLRRLVDDLLDVSRITRGAVELHREHIEFSVVAAQAMELARPLFERKQQSLVTDVPAQGLVVDADPSRLGLRFPIAA